MMRTTPTNAVEALICLPPLELVVQSEVRSAVHHLWSQGSWSSLHPDRGHSSILMRLQQSDPTFNMGVDAMRPSFNFEPKYRVTSLTREDWTRGTGTPPVVKGHVWFTDGCRMKEGTGAGVYGQSVRRRLSFSLGRYATVFQAEIYMLSWHVLMKFNFRDDQRRTSVSALVAGQLSKLFRSSERLHWSNSANRHSMISLPGRLWGCIGSLDMLGYKETEISNELEEAVLL